MIKNRDLMIPFVSYEEIFKVLGLVEQVEANYGQSHVACHAKHFEFPSTHFFLNLLYDFA